MPESHAPEESGKNLKTHLVQTLILHIIRKLPLAAMMFLKAGVFLGVGKRCQARLGTSRCQLGPRRTDLPLLLCFQFYSQGWGELGRMTQGGDIGTGNI